MAKMQYAFHKEDWDAIIGTKGIRIEPEHLPKINKTELVEILRLMGIRVHRGMRRSELIKILTVGQSETITNPMDHWRDLLIRLFQQNRHRILSQLKPMCEVVDGNCYKHDDLQVLACAKDNRHELEKLHGR